MTAATKTSVAKVLSAATRSSVDRIAEIEAAARHLRQLMEQATGREFRCHIDVAIGFALVAERLNQDGGTP